METARTLNAMTEIIPRSDNRPWPPPSQEVAPEPSLFPSSPPYRPRPTLRTSYGMTAFSSLSPASPSSPKQTETHLAHFIRHDCVLLAHDGHVGADALQLQADHLNG